MPLGIPFHAGAASHVGHVGRGRRWSQSSRRKAFVENVLEMAVIQLALPIRQPIPLLPCKSLLMPYSSTAENQIIAKELMAAGIAHAEEDLSGILSATAGRPINIRDDHDEQDDYQDRGSDPAADVEHQHLIVLFLGTACRRAGSAQGSGCGRRLADVLPDARPPDGPMSWRPLSWTWARARHGSQVIEKVAWPNRPTQASRASGKPARSLGLAGGGPPAGAVKRPLHCGQTRTRPFSSSLTANFFSQFGHAMT